MGSPTSSVQDTRRQIFDTIFGAMAGQVLYTFARLGIADPLGDGERTAAELATTYDADAGSFTRFLRAAAAMGLLTETAPGRFALTDSGGLLREDHPGSIKSLVQMMGDPAMLDAWRDLETSVRTGQTTFEKCYGTTYFEYLGQRPELSAQFNASMRQATKMTAKGLPSSYDFTRFHTVADLGGGDGTLLAAVLGPNPDLRGILFDSAEGVAQADAQLGSAGVEDRVTIVVGDFFDTAPSGADGYLIKSVLHDWDDEQCATILGHVRSVIPDDGRLLIVEPIIPATVDGAMPLQTYLSDLNMMVNTGGRERTRDEFEHLLLNSGFRLDNATRLPPPAAFSLLEALPI